MTIAGGGGGGGDMLADTYDPNNIASDVYDRSNHTGTQPSSTISDFDTKLAGTANVTAFTPSADYHPATKKYVDDNSGGGGGGGDMLADTYDPNNIASDVYDRSNHIGTQPSSTISDFDTKLAGTANVTAFTPSADYHPATKKYVDDNSGGGGGGGGDMLADTYDPNNIASDVYDRSNHIGTQPSSTISDFDTKLAGTANVTAFTPSADYHPATKKYVDDNSGGGGGGGGGGVSVAIIEDQKPAGSKGGTFTSGAWRTRDLNTITSDDDSIVSLSANQFTLQEGKYRIEVSAPAFVVKRHQTKLRNITDSADESIGSNEYADQSNWVCNRSFIDDVITIASAKTFEIQHQCESSRSPNGFGEFGLTAFVVHSVFTQVTITKLG